MPTDRSTTPVIDPLVPAATTPSQRRKRPLRTYSRRSIQARAQEDESPLGEEAQSIATPDSGRGVSPARPLVFPRPEQVEQGERRGRGSILAYFKPLPASSDKAPSDTTSSDAAEPPSTPPSSPPPMLRSRKRRRLTTKPEISGLEQHPSAAPEESIAAGGSPVGETENQQKHDPSMDDACIIVRTELHDSLRPPSSEMVVSTVDHQDEALSALADGKTRKKRPGKLPARDMTQTTLSLSIQKESCFTICAVCDILYNPLNEKDRKEHNRRHAAYARKQKRST